MSTSGTLPASPILQQFQTNNSPSLSSFFSSTNGNSNPFSIGCLSESNLSKTKRCRQRVDAGEPRNNYQGSVMSHLKLNADSKHTDRQFENVDQDEDYESVEQQMEDGDLLMGTENQQSDFELSDEDGNQQPSSNENPIDLCSIGQPPNLSAELPTLIKNDPTENRNSSNSAMSSSSSSKRKRFQPQKQSLKLDHSSADSNDEAALEEKSSSDDVNDTVADSKPRLDSFEKMSKASDVPDSLRKELSNRSNQQPSIPVSLSTNLGGSPYQPNMLAANKMFMEMQRRMYASALSQQQQNQQNGRNEEENTTIVQDAVMKDFARFIQTLNEKFMHAVQKVSADFHLTETEKALLQQLKQQKDQKQQLDWRGPQPFGMLGNAPSLGTMNPLFNSLNLPYGNPRQFLAMAAGQNPLQSIANSISQQSSSVNSSASNLSPFAGLNANNNKLPNAGNGIFPTTVNFPPFNGFVNHAAANNLAKVEDGSPRKKRSKVTDSVRGPRSAVRDTGNSLPASSRSSPQPGGYFAPTMVPHPLYNNTSFRGERYSQSPGNSDELSDYSGMEGSFSQSSTLTHVHLRKAKLMFFYTRYPSSSVLKSYFPDINFNKSNTAQLVKWFSNFREFYYMQMEKFAKQALAEGITNSADIVVTLESEIYKQLNQHYNRNNFITPPETLSNVIEETLKEFFRALQEGRDAEPSWKKSIYKVIQQLDEQIPESFKSPSFMLQLEGGQP